jgi:DDE superfamily endonuclease
MTLHLAEISRTVAPGAHAVLLLDQAGWHLSAKLDIPANITLMPLPSKAPELNPVENIWQFIRDNWLSNRVFRSYNDILDHCCHAWNEGISCCPFPEPSRSERSRDRGHQPGAPAVRSSVPAGVRQRITIGV